MELLGLHIEIWVVLVIYFCAMLGLGWWSKRRIHSQEGYLLGNRQFGVGMMVMHSFGAGTHPGAPAGVMSKTVTGGASGIWVSWMWMFGTPFYWLIAPLVRRMRYLTMADYFQNRFSRAAAVLYIVIATAGMTVLLASVLLATTRTVQGIMGKSTAGLQGDIWFFGILTVMTVVFVIYSYWGGIVAAIRTDMIQGLMIIALSIVAIPAALQRPEVAGLDGIIETLKAQQTDKVNYLSLFDPAGFNWLTVLLLCINAPLSMIAYPHLMSVCAAGRTEWEGRVGFTYGNILKRVCTIGWSLLGLCWLTYLINSNTPINPETAETAFGDSIRLFLAWPVLQGIMLACILAAAMSSGDAVQVTVGGLFSQNIFRTFFDPGASEKKLLRVTRLAGLAVVLTSFFVAIIARRSIVRTIMDYFNILSLVGMSVAMGLVWRRMNTVGVFCSTLAAASAFIPTRYIFGCPLAVTVGTSIAAGLLGGIAGSLLTIPPKREQIEQFFKRIYVPIGQEHKLDLTLDEVVPPSKRWLTAGGLFIVKPSSQSAKGFWITLAICLACVGAMWALLNL